MRGKRYSTSSSEDEALIAYKKEKQIISSHHSLCQDDWQQCEFCDEVFKNRYSLYQHNITHMIIPLIKKEDYKCKQCQSHFISANDLESHMLRYHSKIILNSVCKNNKEKMPDILNSIVEKQVLVKCEDDLNILLNTKLSQNGKKTHDGVTKSQNKSTICITTNRDVTNFAGSSKSIIAELGSSRETNEVPEYTRVSGLNKLKEESLSPTYIKERASSPTDDEKESIRHRLLFEEDIEDSLFKDISDECNVNIEALCQEVSFDFDDAVSVSDSDEGVSVGTLEKLSHNSEINYDTALSNIEHAMNTCEDQMNNCSNAIVNSESTNNFDTVYHTFVDVIDSSNMTVNFESGINYFRDESNGENRRNNVDNALNDTTDSESGNALHFDTLMVPEICVCKYCSKKFPHRYQLIQHEAEHLQVKKKMWHVPLCFICERYIAGNYRTLRIHVAKKHPQHSGDLIYPTSNCQKCGLKYYNYSKHLEYSHGIYKCQTCENVFDTLEKKSNHECEGEFALNGLKNSENENNICVTLMQLCDLCFSFMRIYMRNRQNYEEIGTKTEFGVRQTCDKCGKQFFSVKLVKRLSLRPVSLSTEGRKALESGQKAPNVNETASNDLKTSDGGRNTPDSGLKPYFGTKPDFVRRTAELMKNKIRSAKPMSNKERLMKIHNRLKMLKMISKR